ncbi:MAG: signal peptidase I [Acidimicrobiales bacterium]
MTDDPLGGGPTPDPFVSGAGAGPDPGFPADASYPRAFDDAAAAGEPSDVERHIRTVLEWVAVAVGALAVALVIKTFLLQAFYIPSASMHSTLVEGDRVLVNKLSYRLHDVNRGDVVVFTKPPGEAGSIDDLIKRVIALPGETITFAEGSVYIDGLLLDEPYIDAGVPTLPKPAIPGCANPSPSVDTCTVPEGEVFVLGDNREGSRDSRWFGPIDENSIVGRAFLKVWPLSAMGFL